MASKRHKTHKRIVSQPRKHRALSHVEKLEFIRKREHVKDPTSTRSVSAQYNRLKNFPLHLRRRATKDQRVELKKHGFYTNSKGVIVDSPRNVQRKQIKGAKLDILKNGVIKWSVKQRRDYIIGFTKADKKEFARDPLAFQKKKLAELRKTNPSFKGLKRKPQVRLQWGAYQATKDFAPGAFPLTKTDKQLQRIYAGRPRKSDVDKLTGFHIVIHVPRKRKKGKKNVKRRRA